jgi:hypothetical protein
LLYAADARVISAPYKRGKDTQTASIMIRIIQIQMHHSAVTTYAKFISVSCATDSSFLLYISPVLPYQKPEIEFGE